MTADATQLETYFRSVRVVDAVGASDFTLELFDEGMPVQRITDEVLGPAQVRVGELWQHGDWSVADEHAATAVTETAVLALGQAAQPRTLPQQRHILVVCPEGEWHTLPARMAAVVGAGRGARVTVLGPSLPADQLAKRLGSGDVDLVALSCTMPTNLVGAARVIAVAHEQDVPVLAGGRAFGATPLRARALGADGWSLDPAALLEPAPARSGRAVEPSREVLVLDAVDSSVVSLVCERMVASPWPAALDPSQRTSIREDVVMMARCTAAALLTGDCSIVDELLLWLCSRRPGRLSPEVVLVLALLLADTVEDEAPCGAELLRQAAGRTVPRGWVGWSPHPFDDLWLGNFGESLHRHSTG